MTKNSSFQHFRAIFVSYCPLSWGSGVIYMKYDILYILEWDDIKLIFLQFMAIFVIYCPQFWGSGVIYKDPDTQYMFERHDQKLIVFAF
jgi:hypothetical protein